MHQFFVWLGEHIACYTPVQKVLALFYGIPKNTPMIEIDGLKFPAPVCLAAGFDYNGKLSHCLWSMGFGGEEVGSVTARSCEGNVPPRLTRLIKSQSILVYKGLRNDGVENVIKRLKNKIIPSSFVLGISIAKTNDYLSVELEDGIEDYFYSLKRLVKENIGDFYTINISCPNVHGGEDFASAKKLNLLLTRLKEVPHRRPMYVKLPINKPWEEFKEMLEIVVQHGLQGVVIGNLNKNYDDLSEPKEKPLKYRGGVSGLPCQKLSNELISKTRQLYPKNLTIIGCGGVLTAEDALEKLNRGANLVQLVTGMIFNGPHLMREISREYKKKYSHVKV
jgi:dihydroorotate dehydrogenase subfamily 2